MKKLLAITGILAALFFAVGCEEDPGDEMEDAMEETGDAVEGATD
ncbi:MAG: hypothetical protein ACOCVG_01095 [Verrucomicrobiota bacterium]